MTLESYLPIFLLLAAFGSIVLIGILLRELVYLYKNFQAKRWPSTFGELLYAEVAEIRDDGFFYQPSIKYTYSIDGVSYESSTYSFGISPLNSKDTVRDICNELSCKDRLLVYYSPAKPEEATLKPGFSEFNASSLIWVLVATVAFSPFHLVWIALWNYFFVWET